nr:hypothetical protein [Tanacetum cinerariifolium]
MRRVGKGFSGVDKPLFVGMLVPQQAQDVENVAEDEDAVNEVFSKSTSPSPTPSTLQPPPQPKHIPSPPQADTTQPSPPPKHQPSQTAKISITLLNTLLEICATLTKQVANLEQDKVGTSQRVESSADIVMDDQEDSSKQRGGEVGRISSKEPTKVEEVIKVVTAAKLMTKIVTTATTTIIAALVPKEGAPRKRKGVIIQDPEDAATTS